MLIKLFSKIVFDLCCFSVQCTKIKGGGLGGGGGRATLTFSSMKRDKHFTNMAFAVCGRQTMEQVSSKSNPRRVTMYSERFLNKLLYISECQKPRTVPQYTLQKQTCAYAAQDFRSQRKGEKKKEKKRKEKGA